MIAPNHPLQQTAAAILVLESSLSLSAAAAAELCRFADKTEVVRMHWFELCDNPRGVTAYYSDPPSLDDVVLRELNLMDGAPSVHFWFELPTAPDLHWAKWDNQNEVATIVLALSPAKDLRFQGWGHGSRGSFRLERLEPKLLRFSFESKWFSCFGECEHAMIEDLRASRRR